MLVARHFQYKVEIFFKFIIIEGLVGKILYYAVRIELQVRGNPHIHSFIWILNSHLLRKKANKENGLTV